MKKITNIILSFAYITAFIAGISWAQSNSKALTVTKLHSTPEYLVQSQVGNKVKLIFDDTLMSGTDAACERTERIIENLVIRGYQVEISNNGWKPEIDLSAFEAELEAKTSDKY